MPLPRQTSAIFVMHKHSADVTYGELYHQRNIKTICKSHWSMMAKIEWLRLFLA